MTASDLGSIGLTLLIIIGLFILGYTYFTKRTLTDLIREIRDLLKEKKEGITIKK